MGDRFAVPHSAKKQPRTFEEVTFGYVVISDIVAERSKARGSGPRLARGVGSNPTDVNSFFAPFCRPTDVKRFCRPNRCQGSSAFVKKTGEAREVSPSRSSPFEATPPGTDVTPPTCTGVYMLFFSGFEAMPL